MAGNEHEKLGMDLPSDLKAILRAVDELASRDRLSAPVTLEDRLFVATRGSLTGTASAPVVLRRVRWMTGVRVAAAVALFGSVGAIWLAQMRGGIAPGGSGARVAGVDSAQRLEQDVDLLLAMRNSGAGLEGMSDALDLLQLDAEVIGDSLQPDWPSVFDDGATR